MVEDAAWAELRNLVLGPERSALARLRERVETPSLRAEDVAEVMPEAFEAAARDRRLRRSVVRLVEDAITLSVQRNPRLLTDAIFPIIGAAIRKAVAAAMQSLTDNVNQTVERRMSWRGLLWRLESWRSGRSFGEVVLLRSALYRVEQVFLIHRRTGLVLAHQVAPGAVARDAGMVSGMLTAIQDFVRDSFGAGDDEALETMRVGEHSVWLQQGPQALVAGVVRGMPPPELRGVFERTAEEIHQRLGPELAAFDGSTAPLDPAEGMLRQCLLGRAPERKRPPILLWAAVVLLIGAIGVAGLLWWRDSRLWSSYMARVAAQPGILITGSEHPFPGRYEISGLRDPIAADPTRMLETAGIDPSRVGQHWEPFVSAVPAFVAARQFDQLRERIEHAAVGFRSGSAEPEPGAMETLAADLRTLVEVSRRAGRPVSVEVRGYTDMAGTAQANAAIARQRAANVVRELLTRGVSESILALPGGLEPDEPSRSRTVMLRLARR
jgi:outer membrane protein OmpA-like peptidoglycan-associated protein